jgi:hypothetical protein
MHRHNAPPAFRAVSGGGLPLGLGIALRDRVCSRTRLPHIVAARPLRASLAHSCVLACIVMRSQLICTVQSNGIRVPPPSPELRTTPHPVKARRQQTTTGLHSNARTHCMFIVCSPTYQPLACEQASCTLKFEICARQEKMTVCRPHSLPPLPLGTNRLFLMLCWMSSHCQPDSNARVCVAARATGAHPS